MLACCFKNVIEPTKVDVPSGKRPLLGSRRKQSGEGIDGANVVTPDNLKNVVRLRAVEVFIRALGRRLRLNDTQIRCDHAIDAIAVAQGRNKLRTYLAERPSDQD